jgi:hypothetical protein
MRAALVAGFIAVSAAALDAQAVLRPNPSGRATSEVVLAFPRGQAPEGTRPFTIKLDYGVPHLRGRTMHTGDLVPYGEAWRTGANDVTTLTTGVDLLIGGTAVPTGAYVIYTIPERTGWTLVLQKSANQSATEYDMKLDFARLPMRVSTLASPLESLSGWLIPSTEPGVASGELRFAWGTTQVSVDWRLAR